jgi:adenylate cyclase
MGESDEVYHQDSESMGIALEKDRFEEQTLNGESGYFDKMEKVFISKKALDLLIEVVCPPLGSGHATDIEQILESSRSRVAQNLKNISALGKDSYSQIFLSYLSHSFLLKNKSKRELMAILYIDLVGSTAMAAIISPEQLTTIVRVFCQEMAIMISRHRGYVLKYAGDAVIGYFPTAPDIETACENAIECAFAMKRMIEESINVILMQNRYPKMRTRITIDAGENQILVLGSEPDLLGHVVSRAAKIMGRAKPNQIAIGANVYTRVRKDMQEKFREVEKYDLAETGEAYRIYVSVE